MATLTTLAARGSLLQLEVELDHGQFPTRFIYALPEVVRWLDTSLPQLQPGRLNAEETPAMQVDALLYRWISGEYISYGRMLKDLMPMQDEVWELKTADVRIFGWFYQPRTFIAVVAGYADDYKVYNRSRTYADALNRVKAVREHLDLDEPKIATGNYDDLVSVPIRR